MTNGRVFHQTASQEGLAQKSCITCLSFWSKVAYDEQADIPIKRRPAKNKAFSIAKGEVN